MYSSSSVRPGKINKSKSERRSHYRSNQGKFPRPLENLFLLCWKGHNKNRFPRGVSTRVDRSLVRVVVLVSGVYTNFT